MQFLRRRESCGQCTPCRVGTAKALELMAQAANGTRRCWRNCRPVMADASICGLGQAAPNPVLLRAEILSGRARISRWDVADRKTHDCDEQTRKRRDAGRVQARRQDVVSRAGETIIQAAERSASSMPHLCYTEPGYAPRRQLPRLRGRDQGRARAGAVVLPHAEPGMKVKTDSARARRAQKMVLELLLVRHAGASAAHDPNSELWTSGRDS